MAQTCSDGVLAGMINEGELAVQVDYVQRFN